MIQFVLLGLGVGALYSISALGIVTIHRGSGVLNLAHGAMAMWGAYLFVDFRDDRGVSAWAAGGLTLAIAAMFGVLTYLVVIRPIRHRSPVSKMVMTLGLFALLSASLNKVFDTFPRVVGSSLPDHAISVFGTKVGVDRLILLAIGVAITIVLEWWSSVARLPIATRAIAEHERAAVALGASPHLLGSINWALGSALAVLSGILLVPIVGLGPTTLTFVAVPALVAALLGRFESYPIALAGGLLLGVAESLTTRYVRTPGWSSAAPLVVLVIALVLQRQTGGNRLPAQLAPAVARGRFRPLPAILAVVGIAAIITFASREWADAAILSICFAILGLSLVVLLGYAYQMSLAQMAIAGAAALATARMAIAWDLPFVVAPLAGACVGAVIGLVIGIPALRIRGVHLAIVTLALGLAFERVLFQNPRFTGGFNGLTPRRPDLFGWDIDAAAHPNRYAFFALAWLLLCAAAMLVVRRSRFGRRLLAMRTNERAAESLGINVTRSKLAAFVIASALAGVAGVLLSFRQTQLAFVDYTGAESMNLVVLAVISGVGSIVGGLLVGWVAPNGIVYHFLDARWAWLDENYFIIAGVGLIIALRVHQHGMMVRAHEGGHEEHEEEVSVADAEAPPSEGQILEVSDVRVAFGGVVAVDGVNLRVEPGRVVAVVGPNGAGKTTLVDIVNGFVRTAKGMVRLGSTTLQDLPPYARARAGLARGFQAIELFEDLTVGENLMLAADSSGRSGGRFPAAAAHALDRFGLRDALGLRPSELSLAQRRLVGVVRALASRPSVLILDEPGAGLGRVDSRRLAMEVRRLAEEYDVGVLLIDHDMGLVTDACDELVVLATGAVLASGTPAVVLSDQRVRDVYLGETPAALAPDVPTRLQEIDDDEAAVALDAKRGRA